VRKLKHVSVSLKSREAGDKQPITNVVALPPNELYEITKMFVTVKSTI
jgi:hypothetical protein